MKSSKASNITLFEPRPGGAVLEVRVDDTDRVDRVRVLRRFPLYMLAWAPLPLILVGVAFWSRSWLSYLVAALATGLYIAVFRAVAVPIPARLSPRDQADVEERIARLTPPPAAPQARRNAQEKEKEKETTL